MIDQLTPERKILRMRWKAASEGEKVGINELRKKITGMRAGWKEYVRGSMRKEWRMISL